MCYDQHWLFQVADYCRERLHRVLAEEIAISDENRSFDDGGSTWKEEWESIFHNCFHRVDDEVEAFAPAMVGSTALIALVSSTHVVVGNCGDSRAVLCRGRVSIPLSMDHKVTMPLVLEEGKEKKNICSSYLCIVVFGKWW